MKYGKKGVHPRLRYRPRLLHRNQYLTIELSIQGTKLFKSRILSKVHEGYIQKEEVSRNTTITRCSTWKGNFKGNQKARFHIVLSNVASGRCVFAIHATREEKVSTIFRESRILTRANVKWKVVINMAK